MHLHLNFQGKQMKSSSSSVHYHSESLYYKEDFYFIGNNEWGKHASLRQGVYISIAILCLSQGKIILKTRMSQLDKLIESYIFKNNYEW